MRKISAVVWRVSLQDRFWNILLDPLLLPLGSTTHLPTVIVAQALVDKVAMIRSKWYILIGC